MAIYMKIDGVNGSVQTKDFDKWIPLDSLSFGMSRMVEMVTGQVANRSGSMPNFSEIAVGKPADEASYGLMQKAVSETEGMKIEIVTVTPKGKNQVIETQRVVMEDAIFSSFSQSGGSEGNPYESMTFGFSKLEVKFTPYDAAGKKGEPASVIYDLKKSEAG